MNCSELIAKRRGSLFQKLFANEGLWVYFKGHLVLHFGAIYRVDDGTNMLYVCESE